MRTEQWQLGWLITAAVLVMGCTEPGERESMQRALDRNHTRWNALGLSSYAMRERVLCFCVFGPEEMILTVEDDQIVSLVDAATGEPADTALYRFYYTVEELFTLAGEAIRDADAVRIVYDPTQFFPIEIAIDWIEAAIDDELTVEARSLEP